MPFYEYQCQVCGAEHEALQRISDPPLTDCPACGKPALKKRISAAGFRLKGSGWYETDFKRGGQKRNLHETGDKQPSEKADKKEGTGEKKEAAPKKAESKASGTSATAAS